jgi:hypothetical protein
MLSVDYNGIGIPLFWMILNSAGNTKTKQRIQMMQKVIQRIRIDRIKVLLADREFIGEAWFDYLISKNIPLYISLQHAKNAKEPMIVISNKDFF